MCSSAPADVAAVLYPNTNLLNRNSLLYNYSFPIDDLCLHKDLSIFYTVLHLVSDFRSGICTNDVGFGRVGRVMMRLRLPIF